MKEPEDKPTVLYVEDDTVNVLLVERVLDMRPDVRLIVAGNAAQGLQLAAAHRPDLILLDVRLPDMSGDEVLQRLRQAPATRTTPVVMTTADDRPTLATNLLALGASDLLRKPVEIPMLLALLDRYASLPA